MPLSPSFPDWLLKRDPTLAGALTNPLFLAFETRRQRGSAVRRFGRGTLPALRENWMLLMFVGFVPALAVPHGGKLWCATFLILAVLDAMPSHTVPNIAKLGPLPENLRKAFLNSNSGSRVLSDLFTTPATSSDFFEALVLEGRGDLRIHILAPAICALVWGTLTALYMEVTRGIGTMHILYEISVVSALAAHVPFLASALYWELARRVALDRIVILTNFNSLAFGPRMNLLLFQLGRNLLNAFAAFGLAGATMIPAVMEARYKLLSAVLMLMTLPFSIRVMRSGRRRFEALYLDTLRRNLVEGVRTRVSELS